MLQSSKDEVAYSLGLLTYPMKKQSKIIIAVMALHSNADFENYVDDNGGHGHTLTMDGGSVSTDDSDTCSVRDSFAVALEHDYWCSFLCYFVIMPSVQTIAQHKIRLPNSRLLRKLLHRKAVPNRAIASPLCYLFFLLVSLILLRSEIFWLNFFYSYCV